MKAAGVDLFSAAAERAAMVSERPVSQEALRVRGLDVPAAGPLLELHGFGAGSRTFCGLDGGSATTEARAITCPTCAGLVAKGGRR
jgi:hypothetical protein